MAKEYKELCKSANTEHEQLFKKTQLILDYKRVLIKQQQKIHRLEDQLKSKGASGASQPNGKIDEEATKNGQSQDPETEAQCDSLVTKQAEVTKNLANSTSAGIGQAASGLG